MSIEAITIARVTGTISSVSSAVIMYIIIKSASSLSTSYHRIMFFTSFWDLLTSAAIALTTIPMPKDVIYDFDSVSYGNVTSCSVQGFIAYIGSILGIFSICILCIYYLCALKYKYEDRTIRTYVEPVLFISSIVLAFFPGIVLWRSQHINPQPYEPYCTIGSYPFGCRNKHPEEECIRGDESKIGQVGAILNRFYLFFVILFGVLTVSISMAMIVSTVRTAEKAMAKAKAARRSQKGTADANGRDQSSLSSMSPLAVMEPDSESQTVSRIRNTSGEESEGLPRSILNSLKRARRRYRLTKTVTIQALMYVTAFVLTWIFTILAFAMRKSVAVAVLKMIFQPLQGFFNALIFVYHKTRNLREIETEMGICEAIVAVFRKPSSVPEVMISRIELVGIEEQISSREVLRRRSNIGANENYEVPAEGNNAEDEDVQRDNEDRSIASGEVSSRGMNVHMRNSTNSPNERNFYTLKVDDGNVQSGSGPKGDLQGRSQLHTSAHDIDDQGSASEVPCSLDLSGFDLSKDSLPDCQAESQGQELAI